MDRELLEASAHVPGRCFMCTQNQMAAWMVKWMMLKGIFFVYLVFSRFASYFEVDLSKFGW